MAIGSRQHLPIIAAAFGAAFVAILGSTMTDLGPWYRSLEKPSWQPPDWLFGPAWTLIFALVALSAARAWRYAPSDGSREWLLGLFALNGFLNILWSFLFFRMQRPDWALWEVGVLWLSILWLIMTIWRHTPLGALLLLPYLMWVSFASVLNVAIVSLN